MDGVTYERRKKIIEAFGKTPNVINAIKYYAMDGYLSREQVTKLVLSEFPNISNCYVIDGKSVGELINEAVCEV